MSTSDAHYELDPEVEKELREAAEREEAKMMQDMKEKCSQEFNKRQSMMAEQFSAQLKSQMSHVGDRYTSHTQDMITGKQTDVLRANKVIRDLSRDMGDEWKQVFSHLMKDEDQGKVKVELARIERQKPFLQPLKALNAWKDLKGDRFQVRALVDALITVGRKDLAEKAMDILENDEIESLYAIDGVGTGIAAGSGRIKVEKTDANGTDSKPERPQLKPATIEDPIADGKLLKIAKAIGKDWETLAKALEISDEDIEDTRAIAGDTHHGGFKCLFVWRDNCIENGLLTNESASALKDILTKINRKDLADTIVIS